MSRNLLGFIPYKDEFFSVVIEQVRRVLLSKANLNNIEIEIKHAEFQYFHQTRHINDFKTVDKNMKDKIDFYVNQQITVAHQTIKNLSNQTILYLNPLTRSIYRAHAGFDERTHKKFYHIKDFFSKLCECNKQHGYRMSNGRQQQFQNNPTNIYEDLRKVQKNWSFSMKQESQYRLDIYLTNRAPQKLQGRYSYTNLNGWKKTMKNPLCEQIDFMLGERVFRFAIVQQVETDVSFDHLCSIYEAMSKPGSFDVRLKHTMKVLKGNTNEFALSQIYESLNSFNEFPDLKDMILREKHEINLYLVQEFANFFTMEGEMNAKFEMESEFMKPGLQILKKYAENNQNREIKYEIQTAIQDLFALYFVDHNTKKRQSVWIDKLSQSKNAELKDPRLQNEFGTYMHDYLYDKMNQRR